MTDFAACSRAADAGFLGISDGAINIALDAKLFELPEERVAGRPCLVAKLELTPLAELVDELSHRFRRVLELPEVSGALRPPPPPR